MIAKYFYGCDGRIEEVLRLAISVFWGCMLLLPGDLFTTTKTFNAMSKIAPENVWGVIPFCILFVYVFPARGGSNLFRKAAILLLALFWLVITMSVLFANPLSTAGTVYAGYFILTIVGYLRVKK